MSGIRVAVVSGTSSGIGQATAEVLLERGYTVIGVSRRGNPALAPNAAYIDRLADARDPHAVRAVIETVPEATAHGIKAVVLNAGYSPQPADLPMLPWETVVDTYTANVATALHLVQATSELIKQSGGGSYTFVGASLANGYTPERFSYAASKAAMTTLMRACSKQFADDGIVANEVRPGPVATAMTGFPATVDEPVLKAINQGFDIDWLKSARTVAEWIATIAEFPPNGPTGQVFNYSRKVL